MAHYRVNAGYLPLSHWLHDPQRGGGRIIGEGCHFIDFLIFLVGENPQTVVSHGLPDMGRYSSDNVTMTFTFPDGSIGTVSYLANGNKNMGKEYLEVFCGGKSAILDDFRSLELIREGNRTIQHAWLRQDKGHYNSWVTFLQSLSNAAEPPIPYTQLLGGAMASFAALESLTTRKEIEITGLE